MIPYIGEPIKYHEKCLEHLARTQEYVTIKADILVSWQSQYQLYGESDCRGNQARIGRNCD